MSFIEKVRQRVRSIVSREQSLWSRFVSNSNAYERALALSSEDLEALGRDAGRGSMYPTVEEIGAKGFLTVTVEGVQFALTACHVCGAPYGGSWVTCISAVCVTDETLNEWVGHGTTLISVIPQVWHDKLVVLLGQEDDRPSVVH